jgi:hypothetical protein
MRVRSASPEPCRAAPLPGSLCVVVGTPWCVVAGGGGVITRATAGRLPGPGRRLVCPGSRMMSIALIRPASTVRDTTLSTSSESWITSPGPPLTSVSRADFGGRRAKPTSRRATRAAPRASRGSPRTLPPSAAPRPRPRPVTRWWHRPAAAAVALREESLLASTTAWQPRSPLSSPAPVRRSTRYSGTLRLSTRTSRPRSRNTAAICRPSVPVPPIIAILMPPVTTQPPDM